MRLALEQLEARLLLAHPAVSSTESEPNNGLEAADVLSLETTTVGHDPYRLGAFVEGRITSNATDGTDVDYFKIDTASGGKFALSLAGPAVLDGVRAALIDARGAILSYADNVNRDETGLSSEAYTEFWSNAGGEVYVIVGHLTTDCGSRASCYINGFYDQNAMASVEYSLGLQFEVGPRAEHEPNDNFDQANTILLKPLRDVCQICLPDDGSLRGFVDGELKSDMPEVPDRDFFRLEVPGPSAVQVQMSQWPVSNERLVLFDGAGHELASDDEPSDGYAINWLVDAPGQFFASVEQILAHPVDDHAHPQSFICFDYADRPGICVGPHQYTLDVFVRPASEADSNREREPNNITAQANPIVLEGPSARQRGFVKGTLDNRTALALCLVCGPDFDFFSFSASAGSRIKLQFTSDAARGGVMPWLLDGSKLPYEPGSVLATGQVQDADGDGTRDSAVLDFLTQTGGLFFVQISVRNAGLGNADFITQSFDYRLDVTVRPASEPDPNREREPNDDFASANPITIEPLINSQPDSTLGGFIRGDLTFKGRYFGPSGCGEPDETGNINCTDDLVPYVYFGPDFFWFDVSAEREIQVTLPGETHSGLWITLFGSAQEQLVTDDDSSDGLSLRWATEDGGVFFVEVYSGSMRDDTTCAYPGSECEPHPALPYLLKVNATPLPDAIEDPNEAEPNDSIEQAKTIELVTLPTFAPGVELRGGDVHGIAGGPTGDQDVFQFELREGERVNVGVQSMVFASGRVFASIDEWLTAAGLDEFGDPAGTRHAAPGHPTVSPHGRLQQILAKRPDVFFGPVDIVVLDSAGDEIGRSSDSDANAHRVAFDAAADGTYYAIVSSLADSERPIHYRLGVLAEAATNSEPNGPPGDGEAEDTLEITLKPGQSFQFTDSDGDRVNIVFQGRGSTALVTFTASMADGSDIASVVIDGVRRPGNLIIRSDGTAEVGSVEIHGVGDSRSRRRAVTFGRVDIDGNLGSLSSDLDLRAVTVDGILGELTAPGRALGRVSALVFDRAMADVASIRTITVEAEMADALFQHFLP